MKIYLLLIPLCLLYQLGNSAIYQVGSTKTYASPNALMQAEVLVDGDTIEIDAESYIGTSALAVWQANNLLIKGVGGRPHLEANGEAIWGKGIWIFAGNNITVENIEFSGATVPDQNGAGIRLDGIGLTVRHCFFHNNENGILTNNSYDGDILIEYCEFDNNGQGDGFSHNLYIGHVNKLIFQYNYSHHAYIGHNLKSRAQENYILYNRIMDEDTGESSRLIDLSNGGFSILMGNLFMQGNNAQNNNLVGYGLEGLSNDSNEFYFINNTCVNKRTASGLFLHLQAGTPVANVSNNIFTGTGILINGEISTMSNNLIETEIESLHFADEINYDYNLSVNSPAVDFGIAVASVNGYSLTPNHIYYHPTEFKERTVEGSIDAGAYEWNSPTFTKEDLTEKFTVYPNPFQDQLLVQNIFNVESAIHLFDISGKNFSDQISYEIIGDNIQIDTKSLPQGMYILTIGTSSKTIIRI